MLHVYLPWHLLCTNYDYIGSGECVKVYGRTNRTHHCNNYQPRAHRWLRHLLQESNIKEAQQEGLCNDHRYTGRSILCQQLVDSISSMARPADWANTRISQPPSSIPSKTACWAAHHSELSCHQAKALPYGTLTHLVLHSPRCQLSVNSAVRKGSRRL
jgi:hypothetical protein